MAGINVAVNAGTTAATSSVAVTGFVQHVITDTEVTSFGIGDSALKNAIGKYFGKNPDDAYLHSSTPWNDLYTTYNWPQVQTTLSVVSARITGITSDPTIVLSQVLANDSNTEGTFNASISQAVSNTVETNWSMTETVTVTQDISYEVGFLGAGGGGSTSLSFGMSFGQGGSKSENVTLGSSAGVVVDLKPHQEVDATLTASKGTLSVRVVYQASLSGDVAINYGSPYKGHHFYALPVASVMQAAGINNALQFTEDLTIGFFANSEVHLKDAVTKAPIAAIVARSASAPVLKPQVLAHA